MSGGEISWRLLHDVFDEDLIAKRNLSMPLALSIFDPTTSSAIESYFPKKSDADFFLNSFMHGGP